VIATPALDLHDGSCVQLVGGRPEDERVSLPDPVAEARGWRKLGFATLHVVDLDAALGTGDNRDVVAGILRATDADVQVGGGVRDDARANGLLSAGADRIVVGTRALADREWLIGLADRHPGRVIIALDTRDGRILSRGWTEATDLEISSFLPGLAGLPLAGVLCTDVGREGRMEGIDRTACARVVEASAHPVWISGGVTTIEDLSFLESVGTHAVVLGMAIYTGTLDRETVATRWGDAHATRAHRDQDTEPTDRTRPRT
jgi:phosphoribosylformimino-5-aminoimidazole carboxamide ribotide isomerase